MVSIEFGVSVRKWILLLFVFYLFIESSQALMGRKVEHGFWRDSTVLKQLFIVKSGIKKHGQEPCDLK